MDIHDGNTEETEREGEPSSALDGRMKGLEDEEEPPFLREQQRVPPRRRISAKPSARRLRWIVLSLALLAVLVTSGVAAYRYLTTNERFRLENSLAIDVSGTTHVTRDEVCEIFGADIGRNIFAIALDDRRRALEQLPWVESATVMRILPNHLKVVIRERNPVAFVQLGTKIALIDANGSLMALPPVTPGGNPLAFPVITGMQSGDLLAQRAARMKVFMQLVSELNTGNSSYAGMLDEVDLGDPEDLQLTVSDAGGIVLLHLGSSPDGGNGYLSRFKIYADRIAQWRQQYPHIKAVDLRFDGRYYLETGGPAVSESTPAAEDGAGNKDAAAPAKPQQEKTESTTSKKNSATTGGKSSKAASGSRTAVKKHAENSGK